MAPHQTSESERERAEAADALRAAGALAARTAADEDEMEGVRRAIADAQLGWASAVVPTPPFRPLEGCLSTAQAPRRQ